MTRSPLGRRAFRVRAAASLLVLGTVAGCSDETDSERTEPVVVDYETPPGPAGGPTAAAGDPAVEKLVGSAISGPWSLAAAADGGADEVKVWAELTGCHRLVRGVAVETDQTVTIAILLREISRPGVVCNASIVYRPVTVALDAPLGDRKLQHAPIDVEPIG
ncbi:MAG: hypothetical protein Q7J48_12695 [Nocardioides sp.]|nr:hypothetical protein [Nocardioides sp.]